jgi:uncharacterized protein (UPF0261 family)
MSGKTILVLATLDTKGREAQYLREQMVKLGDTALVMDTGVVGAPAARADIPRGEVARAGGMPLARLLDKPSRATAAPVMAEGATRLALGLLAQGKIHGVLGLGGTQGTTLCTKVMRALPYGFPKVMVSTMASGNVARWVDVKDITMMFSVSDILGLNPLARKVLANAAGAVCGAASVDVTLERRDKPLVAVTTVGITTQGAMKAMEVFEAAGYEVIVFHAIGAGGRAMEQLMREGVIGAVLDYATIEVSNQLFDALLAADDERLTTAGKLGLPQVLCPGAIEVLVFGEPATVPAAYRGRTLIRHSPQITDVRLNRDEMVRVAEEVARRLRHTTDEAVFLVPTAGFDSYAVKGRGFHDPEADRAFVETLKARLPANVRMVERPTHIDDPDFAAEAAQQLMRLIEARQSQ